MICLRAGRQDVLRALDGADAAADAAGQAQPAIWRTIARLSPVAHRGIEVDHLHLREAFEATHPRENVVVADGEVLALYELDDGAVLQIDCGDQHETSATKARRHEDQNAIPEEASCFRGFLATGMPCASKVLFQRVKRWFRRSERSTPRARRRPCLR